MQIQLLHRVGLIAVVSMWVDTKTGRRLGLGSVGLGEFNKRAYPSAQKSNIIWLARHQPPAAPAPLSALQRPRSVSDYVLLAYDALSRAPHTTMAPLDLRKAIGLLGRNMDSVWNKVWLLPRAGAARSSIVHRSFIDRASIVHRSFINR